MKLKNMSVICVCLATVSCFLTSCSVVMAAHKKGTSIEDVQCSRSRGQLLLNGGTVISSERQPTGELVEVYQFKKEQGSAARAFMHGLLDISTLGLWEVVGTPLEACMSNDKSYCVKVFYDGNEKISKIELL